jgi:hypothetical protein
MVLAMKEDLSLRRSHAGSVYPKRPDPDISANKVAGMQCMYLLSECSACTCCRNAVHVLALGMQFIYLLLECSACTCSRNAVHVLALGIQCMYLLSECSTCTCSRNAVYVYVPTVGILIRAVYVTLCSLNCRREFCLVHINFLGNL